MSIRPSPTLSPPAPAPVAAPRYDVQRVRADFPILQQEVHGEPLVYFDNGASSQKPRRVIEALKHYYETDHSNVHRAAHVLSGRATRQYEEARGKLQRFINARESREIIFVRGTTEAINLVASSYGGQNVAAGDEVVITWMEHHSNIVPWQMLCEAKGAHLRVLPVTDEGELRLEELEKLLTPRTKILALTHVSNALGTVNPIREIVALAHAHGVPVLVDGVQAVPHMKVDVQDLDCDFYCFSGHKMYGPTGIGVLYGKAVLLEAMPPYQGGGDMISSVSFAKTYYNELPYKFEAGTPNVADVIGLGAAVDYLGQLGLDAIAAHDEQLLEHATAVLAKIPGVRIVGTAAHKAAVLSFVVTDPPMSALDVGTKLDLEGVAVRTGHHCCQPLMERYDVPGTARASFGLYNTIQEVDIFAAALRRIVAEAAAKAKPGAPAARSETAFPKAAGPSPKAVADELVELFEFLPDWTERYQHIIELGEKIPPLPAEFKTEANRVKGCQSTVFLQTRKRPGSADVIEFLADSDADIVRGLIALMERVYSGQRAGQIVAFDVEDFFGRLGLNHHLSMGRRNGLAAMVQRVRNYAAEVAGKSAGH